MDSLGTEVGDAPPSIAVQMGGLGAVPTAGDEFAVRGRKPRPLRQSPLPSRLMLRVAKLIFETFSVATIQLQIAALRRRAPSIATLYRASYVTCDLMDSYRVDLDLSVCAWRAYKRSTVMC